MTAPTEGRPRILVVGDNPEVRDVVVPMLQGEGYDVEHGVLLHIGQPGTSSYASSSPRRRDATGLAQEALGERWSLERLEREYILAVLDSVNQHQMKAAAILGIDRRTLYRKLREYQAA